MIKRKLSLNERLVRLENKIGLRENQNLLDVFSGQESDDPFEDYIAQPLYDLWKLSDSERYQIFDETQGYDEIIQDCLVKQPRGYGHEESQFINVQKAAKMLTRTVVEMGLIGRNWLKKPLPSLKIPKLLSSSDDMV